MTNRPVRRMGVFAGAACCLMLLFAWPTMAHGLQAQSVPVRLSLEEALERARERTPGVRMALHAAEELEARTSGARADRLPQLHTSLDLSRFAGAQEILLPAGSIGALPSGGGAMPPEDATLDRVGPGMGILVTTLAQPLSQLLRIGSGYRAAEAGTVAARADVDQAADAAALAALQLFAALSVAHSMRDAGELELGAAQAALDDLSASTDAGEVLAVARMEARVELLEVRQELLSTRTSIQDLTGELAELLGFPPDAAFELERPSLAESTPDPVEEYVDRALRIHPSIRAAAARRSQSSHGLDAALAQRIPEVGIYAQHMYQNALSLFPTNTFRVGVQVEWVPLDFGRRRSAIGERRASVRVADVHLEQVERRVRGEVERSHREVQQSLALLELAREAVALRTEVARLRRDQVATGIILPAEEQGAAAALARAEADLLRSQFGHLLAVTRLELAAGGSR